MIPFKDSSVRVLVTDSFEAFFLTILFTDFSEDSCKGFFQGLMLKRKNMREDQSTKHVFGGANQDNGKKT